VDIFRQYKLVIQITNSTVLNKLLYYSQISALGPEGHCTGCFKRVNVFHNVMWTSTRGRVSVSSGRGESKTWFSCEHQAAPYYE